MASPISCFYGHLRVDQGDVRARVDLVLPRGVTLRGKVIEEGSGRPVEGAALGYAIRDGEMGVPACRVDGTGRPVRVRRPAEAGHARDYGPER